MKNEKTPYVKLHLKKTVSDLNSKINKEVRYDILRRDMPYMLEIKNGIVTPVNRDYKPLCIKPIGEAVDYKDCTLYNIELNNLNLDADSKDNKTIYLYKDGTAPWNNKKSLNEYLNKINTTFNLDSDS